MTQITLSDEQVGLISGGSFPIVIVDSHGRELGQIVSLTGDAAKQTTISDEELTEIKRRMANPGEFVMFQQMRERLGWQVNQ